MKHHSHNHDGGNGASSADQPPTATEGEAPSAAAVPVPIEEGQTPASTVNLVGTQEGATANANGGAPDRPLTEDELRLLSYEGYDDPLALTIMKRTASISKSVVTGTMSAVSTGVGMVVPDKVKSGMNTVVGGTAHGVVAAKDAVVGVIPSQITHAASATTGAIVNVATATTGMMVNATVATGEKMSQVAGAAGNLIARAPEAMVNVIPDAIMSKHTKKLIFVDFNDTMRSFFHTNILTIPYIFNQTGLIVGLLLISMIAFLSEYQTEVFFFAKRHLEDPKKVVVYGDVPKLMWGDWYPTINILHGITHMIGFQIFAAHNMQPILLAWGVPAKHVYLVGLILPLAVAFPMMFIKKSAHLKPMGVITNFLVGVSCIIMVISFPYSGRGLAVVSETPSRLAVSLGVAVYAFTGIGSAVPVERTMSPDQYIRLLRVAVLIAVSLMIGFGLAAYISYGEDTCAVITLSLPKGPIKLTVASLLFVASIFILPMQLFPYAEVIDRRFLGLRMLLPYMHRKANLMRVCMMILCFVVAYFIPFYGLVASIAGAFTCSVLGLIIPAFLDHTARKRAGKMTKLIWVRIALLAFFGTLSFLVGTILTIYDIVSRLSSAQYHPPESRANHTSPCY